MDKLPKCGANYVPLTPTLTFSFRASSSYASHSIIYAVRFTGARPRRFTVRLCFLPRSPILANQERRGLGPCANVPAMLEMHFAVPIWQGAVLNAINTRRDSRNVALILKHSSQDLFIDYEYIDKAKKAIEILMADFQMQCLLSLSLMTSVTLPESA
ncbi:Acyl-CoA synthetase member 3, mitochondrial [Datura stramonium]|uniref:Acyl-CoA synthetase member 3, mitochondrial n=1 Tax=Datura stramonium TaxID=4076 RepID=A0ABS8RI04_DATST|nr:Acyl-CoA synthetase member 3, mitochondrial [Datura stramonium]